jgi:DNA-binding MarR family transcriptional regulator
MGAQLLDVKQSAGRRSAARTAARQRPALLGLLPGLIGYQLRLAQRAIFADFAASVGAEGISPGLFGILIVIEANPGLKQQRLAEAAHLDRSSLVPVIDKLEHRGLVERRAADRRSNGVFLTAQGTALLRKLKRRVQQHERRVVAKLSAREQRELVRLLNRILPERR